ncbi:hypothetical protein [Leuconostoc lactis]
MLCYFAALVALNWGMFSLNKVAGAVALAFFLQSLASSANC